MHCRAGVGGRSDLPTGRGRWAATLRGKKEGKKEEGRQEVRPGRRAVFRPSGTALVRRRVWPLLMLCLEPLGPHSVQVLPRSGSAR